MGFPPPPPNGPQPPPDQGGGFGPPQGFGPPPPPPPGDGYGYPQQGGGEGYGYPQQGGGFGPPAPPGPPTPPGGGYGGYPPPAGPGGYPPPGPGGVPPPPPPPNNSKRNAWIVVGCIVAVGAIVGGTLLATNDGGKKDSADPKPSGSHLTVPSAIPSFTVPTPDVTLPSDDPTLDLPTDEPSEPDPTPTEKLVPYVVLSPGQCFDAPTLTKTVDKVTTRSCSSAHDAQVVANETLSGTFSSDIEIQNKALSLCESDARKHLPADGRTYYPYALFPKLITYQVQHRKTVTCSLTRNNGSNGVKLYSKLG